MKNRKIARKIVWWAVFAGLLASLLISGVQFLLEYRARLAQVHESIRTVGETFTPSLTQSLWSYDLPQADLQMQAMVQQPFISSGELILGENEAPRVYGTASEDEAVEQVFELTNVDVRAQPILVGTLILRSDLSRVREQLAAEGLRALIANSLVILVIAAVLTLIFQMLVTRRISAMAAVWGEVTESDLRAGDLHEQITRLSPRHAHKPDEIDQLERVIELLYGTGYRALQEAEQKEHILLELKKKAEAANIAKSEFLANMSHEIRTPMNGVSGIADLLLRSKLSSNQEMLVRQLQSSADNLIQIINDILDFSKIEADELDLNPVAFDPASLIAEVARSFTSIASSKQLELICPATPDIGLVVEADDVRIRQVLVNLISNALKFTEQGHVLINVAAQMQSDDEADLTYSVIDTGVGISEDKQHRLFERFSQADNSVSRAFGGTGLGLAISKRLVELMGGEIGYTPQPIGSEFWVRVPVRLVGRKPPLQNDISQRILVAGCSPVLGQYLENCLEQFSAVRTRIMTLDQLQEAIDAEECQRFVSEYDQIWIDDREDAGWALRIAARIDQLSADGQPRLVLLTNDALFDLEANSEFDERLIKPIQPSEVNWLVGLGDEVQVSVEHAAPETVYENSFEQVRALLVEDNKVNQMVAGGLLKHLGVAFDTADNGAEALEMLVNEHFDLIIMDIQMPVLDGYQTTAKIRDGLTGVDPNVPIIAMTANALHGDRERCLEAGMNDYLAKPITLNGLVEKLSRWCSGATAVGQKPVSDGQPLTASSQSITNETDDELSVFNESELYELLMDDQELIREVLVTFQADFAEGIQEMKQLQTQGAWEQLGRTAHRIKGAAGHVAAAKLRAIAFELEKAGKAGEPELIEQQLPLLEKAFADVKIEMQGCLERMSE